MNYFYIAIFILYRGGAVMSIIYPNPRKKRKAARKGGRLGEDTRRTDDVLPVGIHQPFAQIMEVGVGQGFVGIIGAQYFCQCQLGLRQ